VIGCRLRLEFGSLEEKLFLVNAYASLWPLRINLTFQTDGFSTSWTEVKLNYRGSITPSFDSSLSTYRLIVSFNSVKVRLPLELVHIYHTRVDFQPTFNSTWQTGSLLKQTPKPVLIHFSIGHFRFNIPFYIPVPSGASVFLTAPASMFPSNIGNECWITNYSPFRIMQRMEEPKPPTL